MAERYWLVTYDYNPVDRYASQRLETEACCPDKGDIGLWWAEKVKWYRDWAAEGREVADRYAAEGKEVPLSEKRYEVKLSLLHVLEISEAAYLLLKGEAGDED